jgi:DNA-binding IclR family transcriptional regulator
MTRNGVQAVDRALQILLAFDSREHELGVTELAARVGVHKSTASRLAATLAGRGFLERPPGSEAFRLGSELGRLGLLALAGRELVELARPAMEQLVENTGETVNLAVLEGGEAVNVAQVDGRHIVGIGSWAGRRTKLHCTANGKVLLAFAGAPLEGPLEAFTERTITSLRTLRRELAGVRERGWAAALGELEEGLHAVAVPVLDPSGRCEGALSVSGPAYRMPPELLGETAARCVSAAEEIGGLIGGSARAA